jgi:hypothetical protein
MPTIFKLIAHTGKENQEKKSLKHLPVNDLKIKRFN